MSLELQEERFPCRLPVPPAGYFLIAENSRDCNWLIFMFDGCVHGSGGLTEARFRSSTSSSSFSELGLPFEKPTS